MPRGGDWKMWARGGNPWEYAGWGREWCSDGWQRACRATRDAEIIHWEKTFEAHADLWREAGWETNEDAPAGAHWALGSLMTYRGEHARAWDLLVAWDRRWGIDRKKSGL